MFIKMKESVFIFVYRMSLFCIFIYIVCYVFVQFFGLNVYLFFVRNIGIRISFFFEVMIGRLSYIYDRSNFFLGIKLEKLQAVIFGCQIMKEGRRIMIFRSIGVIEILGIRVKVFTISSFAEEFF